MSPGLPGCTAITIPASDRLSAERIAHLSRSFQGDPEQHARLVKGEWVALPKGQHVAEGFSPVAHVAPVPLTPNHGLLLGIGWDGGFSPSAVIGQIDGGQVRVFAALNELRIGTLELIERQVLPWLREYAPWSVQDWGANLVHVIDPNMATPSQASINESAERIILEKLGGRIVPGPVRWGPRKDAVLRVLAPRHECGRVPLQIAPGDDTALLVAALGGKWFYPMTPDGQVDRNPKKPNSPWADVGDSFAYLVGWLLGGETMAVAPPGPVRVETEFSLDAVGGLFSGPTFL